MSEKITRTAGNVFKDLGLDAVEAEDLRLRADLMIALKEQILARDEPQAAIAEALGVSQPRISNLLKGKINLFSLDSLVGMLGRLGNTIELTVKAARAQSGGTEVTDRHAWSYAMSAEPVVQRPPTTVVNDEFIDRALGMVA